MPAAGHVVNLDMPSDPTTTCIARVGLRAGAGRTNNVPATKRDGSEPSSGVALNRGELLDGCPR
jgi:superfamily II DNA/RNA helicase